jgi:hypothetical protein
MPFLMSDVYTINSSDTSLSLHSHLQLGFAEGAPHKDVSPIYLFRCSVRREPVRTKTVDGNFSLSKLFSLHDIAWWTRDVRRVRVL